MKQAFLYSRFQRHGSLLAVLLFLTAMLVIIVVVLQPAISAAVNHYQATRTFKARYEVYAIEAAENETLSARFDVLNNQSGNVEDFIAVSTAAEAAILLERNIGSALKSEGVRVERIEGLDFVKGALGEKVAVKVAFAGSTASLDAALAKIGTAFPYYYFEDIVLESADTSLDEVYVEATVYAFRRED